MAFSDFHAKQLELSVLRRRLAAARKAVTGDHIQKRALATALGELQQCLSQATMPAGHAEREELLTHIATRAAWVGSNVLPALRFDGAYRLLGCEIEQTLLSISPSFREIVAAAPESGARDPFKDDGQEQEPVISPRDRRILVELSTIGLCPCGCPSRRAAQTQRSGAAA